MVSIDHILSRLEKVRPSGPNIWMALCPAHDDHAPSLSIKESDDGRILMHCFAGCTTEAICDAMGINPSDLRPQRDIRPLGQPKIKDTARQESKQESKRMNQNKVAGKIKETYDYMDEKGELLFQNVRMEPKDFYYRRPDGKGGWIKNLKGVKRVLYRLPELLAADSHATVFIVEGEKDADRLADLGLVATTNPNGAKKWRPEYSDYLKDRSVVILPDNDEPGQGHANQVVNSLVDRAKDIKIVQLPGLPEKGDVSDWLDAGGTKEGLQQLVDEADFWEPTESCEERVKPFNQQYRSDDYGVYRKIQNGNDPYWSRMTNFNAWILASIHRTDGEEESRYLKIEATLEGKSVVFQIPIDRFAQMNWPITEIGAKAIIYPGQTNREHVRTGIQVLSEDFPIEKVYTHTGWTQHQGQWAYLHGDGAIGPVGKMQQQRIGLFQPSRPACTCPSYDHHDAA